MKRVTLGRLFLGSAILLLLLSPVGASISGAETKIAVVNLQDALRKSDRMKTVEQDMKNMQLQSEAKVGPVRERLDKIQEELRTKKDSLSAEEKERLQTEFRAKAEEIQQEEQSLRAKVTFKSKTVQNVFFAQIQEIIKKIATDEGYSVVHHNQSVAFSQGLPDITEKVAKALDAMPVTEQQATQP